MLNINIYDLMVILENQTKVYCLFYHFGGVEVGVLYWNSLKIGFKIDSD